MYDTFKTFETFKQYATSTPKPQLNGWRVGYNYTVSPCPLPENIQKYFMNELSVIISTAAIIGGLGTISAFIYFIYRIARRIDDAIGVDAQGRTISDRLSRVEHQLWPNGGSSLADQVHKIDASMTKTSAEVAIIKDFIVSGTLPIAEPTIIKPARKRKAS